MFSEDIPSFDILADVTDGPVVTVQITMGAATITLMAEVIDHGPRLHLAGAHIVISGPQGMLRQGQMRRVAQIAMERMGYDEIIIQGAARTTGASPGRAPRPFRFTRRSEADRA